MATIRVAVERRIAAPSEEVYRYLADYRNHHANLLPAAFSNLTVEQGGYGAGTIISFDLRTGGRTQRRRAKVEEPRPGRVLLERYLDQPAVTRFEVVPEGGHSLVRIETSWESGGVRGLVERVLAPRMLTPLYREELERLEAYAQRQRSAGATA